MRIRKVMAGVLLLFAVVEAQGGESRIFTDAAGRTIEAKIVDFNSVDQTILLQLKSGERNWVSPAGFSDDDWAYRKKWIAAHQVLSEKNLRIAFRKKSESVEQDTSGRATFKRKSAQYEIFLENRSQFSIWNLRIESRYFISVNEKVDGKSDRVRQVAGRPLSVQIAPLSSVSFTTNPAVLVKSNVTIGEQVPGYGLVQAEKALYSEQLEGIWLRRYGPVVDGKRVIRDVCYPAGLQKSAD